MSTLPAEIAQRNRQMMGKLLVVVVVMLGFCAAMVPLYRQICAAIGITEQRAVGANASTQVDMGREVKVELLASTAGLPWRFEVMDRSLVLHPGELATVHYRVVNTLGRPVTAQAVMSTAPMIGARYLEKQACFCFTTQTLEAGEARDMPVVFRVKHDAPEDLQTISLSYTFMEVPKP